MKPEQGDLSRARLSKPSKNPTFSKEQILASRLFKAERDLIPALLVDDSSYTIAHVKKLIAEYQKKEVL
jgi:hypothetical protein